MTDKTVETDPDYMVADSILEDGDCRWFRQRIVQALRAEREAAVSNYLKTLEKEGKLIISKSNLQEIIKNEPLYEG